MTVSTYYFDASDSAASGWTNPANAFDGSTSTYAWISSSTGGCTAEGTTAPGSGGTISQVRLRFYGKGNGEIATECEARIESSSGEDLGSAYIDTTSISWSDWALLQTPAGGWTWPKLQALHCRFWVGTSSTTDARAYRAEIVVTTHVSHPAIENWVSADSGG